jgi:FixJ family two-component response regulator
MIVLAQIERPRVLLVEDDSGVRRSIQLLLQARGYDVKAFSSAAQALADPASTDAACLVTDYRMDSMDGAELLRKLRATGWSRPAFLITAFRPGFLAAREDESCFDAILEKPLLDHRLLAYIDCATGRSG